MMIEHLMGSHVSWPIPVLLKMNFREINGYSLHWHIVLCAHKGFLSSTSSFASSVYLDATTTYTGKNTVCT
jgi:hypothetical protein